MFFVVVVLQSLLIAQMSDTFTNVQGDAMRALVHNKARSIVYVEKTTNATKLSWIYEVIDYHANNLIYTSNTDINACCIHICTEIEDCKGGGHY